MPNTPRMAMAHQFCARTSFKGSAIGAKGLLVLSDMVMSLWLIAFDAERVFHASMGI
jgi:hypothetical protein